MIAKTVIFNHDYWRGIISDCNECSLDGYEHVVAYEETNKWSLVTL